jgi:outer membrane protein
VQNTATFQSPSVSARFPGRYSPFEEQGENRTALTGGGNKSTAQQRSASAVRKLILTATGFVCLAGISYFIGTAAGQNGKEAADGPHKVGLIDIGHIFNNYDKLKMLREEFTADLQDSENQAKAKVQRIQELQKEMKQFNEGTPEYAQREKDFAKLTSDYEAFRKVTQRDLQRKEAKVYHTVYLEVQDVVDRYCEKFGFTLVLRFSRDELNSADPQKLAQGLSRTVIFHRSSEDLTDAVLKYLNTQYGKSAPTSAGPAKGGSGAVKPVSGTTSGNKGRAAQ